MNEHNLYKDMYYYLCGKVCDVIEKAETLDEVKEILTEATQQTEKMFVEFEK